MYILITETNPTDHLDIVKELLRQFLSYERRIGHYPALDEFVLVTPVSYIKGVSIAVWNGESGKYVVHLFHRACPKTIPIATAYKLLTNQLDELMERQLPAPNTFYEV